VIETKSVSAEETSGSYAHDFHVSTTANQQTIFLKGKIRGGSEASNQALQGGRLSQIKQSQKFKKHKLQINKWLQRETIFVGGDTNEPELCTS